MFKLYKGSAIAEFVTINGSFYIIWNGVEESKQKVSKKKGNAIYLQLLSNGWKKAKTEEKKAAAPKEPTKRFIFCRESKKIWAIEYSRKKAEMLEEIRPYFKDKDYPQKRRDMEDSLKAYMKSWEASKADEVNEMLQKQFAERAASQQ